MANKTKSAAIVEMFDTLGFTINTNHLCEGSDRYGLFRSPARLKVENIDGSYTVTESYQFFGRLDSLSETERERPFLARMVRRLPTETEMIMRFLLLI